MDGIDIRPGSFADMETLAKLRAQIGWNSGDFFGPALELQHGHLLLARAGEDVVGSGIGIAFGPLGFIGSMVTRPDFERRGIGRAIFAGLLEWLGAAGCSRVELEATAAGGPLYERVFGFKASWHSRRAVIDSAALTAPPASVRPVEARDWPAIARLDRAASGGDRSWALQRLGTRPGSRALVATNDSGEVLAYGARLGESAGPVIAESPGAAEALVRGLGAIEAGPLRLITGGAGEVQDFWSGLGFELTPFDTRMGWGARLESRPEMLYAIINGGMG